MDFAKKILNKYGWSEGQGLGKNSDGIAKPLKASMKFDKAGLGVDIAASDFNNHWWERVFNDAAKNMDVKQETDGVISVESKEEDGLEITTNNYSLKKLKKANKSHGESRYSNFLKVATLTNTGGVIENPDKIDATELQVEQYKVLTDAELFEACGGRTAHKGARHGLKLSGKLARLAAQEEQMLLKLQEKKSEKEGSMAIAKKSKKKKHKEKLCDEQMSTNEQTDNIVIADEEVLLEKKTKKSKKTKEVPKENPEEPECSKSKKKHKEKHCDEQITPTEQTEDIVIADEEVLLEKKTKTGKKAKEVPQEDPEEPECSKSKKKKKRKCQGPEEEVELIAKPKKKKRKE